MNSAMLRRVMFNLVLIATAVPTVFFGLMWLASRVFAGPSSGPWEPDAFLLSLLTLAPQMFVAGLIQHIVLLMLPHRSPTTGRLLAIGLGLAAVPIVMIAVQQGEPGIFTIPPVAMMLFVAIVARLPLRQPTN